MKRVLFFSFGILALVDGLTFANGGGEAAAKQPVGKKLITAGYAQVGAESDWRTANTESFKNPS